jgi:hypothetical protein
MFDPNTPTEAEEKLSSELRKSYQYRAVESQDKPNISFIDLLTSTCGEGLLVAYSRNYVTTGRLSH